MPGTELSRAELAALLADWPVGGLVEFERIEIGTINTSFDVTTERGRFCLRINEDKSAAEIGYESDLISGLAARGVPTPEPLATAAGSRSVWLGERPVNLFPWVEGEHRLPSEVGVGDTGAVGAAVARLHAAADELVDRFDRAGIYTFDHIVDRYRGFAGSTDPHLGAAIASIGEELDALEVEVGRRARLPKTVIHGDLFPDNVLFDGSGVVALLDFEQACTGAALYDLAVCINAWCGPRGTVEPALVAAMIECYLGVRELPELEAESLWIECRAAAVRFAVTRITDVYLGGVELAGRDFREFTARLAEWRDRGAEWLRTLR